ncbi:MAG: helix-turn-helix domain-containing protein [Bacteroidales bacterium]
MKLKTEKIPQGPNRNLKAARVKKGYTQNDIAAKMGLSDTGYKNKENRVSSFREDEISFLLIEVFPEYTYEELFLS